MKESSANLKPLEYIRRHVKKNEEGLPEEAGNRLSVPLCDFKFNADGGIVRFFSGEYQFSFSYSYLSPDDLPEGQQELIPDYINRNLLYSIDRFGLAGEKYILTLSDLLPQGYKVIISFFDQDKAFVDLEEKIIILAGDLTKPKNLLSFLHELGHCHDFEKLSADGKEKSLLSRYGVTIEGNAELLRMERSAWAFALTKIRPFFKLFQRVNPSLVEEDVMSYIRYKLGTYEKEIARDLASHWSEDVKDKS